MGVRTSALTVPVTADDTVIAISDPTGLKSGQKVVIETEILRIAQGYTGGDVVPVIRGQSGTMTAPHAMGIQVVAGDAMVDFTIRAAPGQPTDIPGLTPWSPWMSVTRSGLIPVPQAAGMNVIALNTVPTGAPLAVTLPAPPHDINGALLLIIADALPSVLTIRAFESETISRTVGLQGGINDRLWLMAYNGTWIELGGTGAEGGGSYSLSATGDVTNLDFGGSSVIVFTGTNPTIAEVVNVFSLKAGRSGQLLTVLNGTAQGVVWLQHLQGTAGNRLFNKVTQMPTPLGMNGSAIYQYVTGGPGAGDPLGGGLWHLISHDQGFPIPYFIDGQWTSQNAPPAPNIGSGQFTHTILLRETMLMVSIDMVWAANSTPGSGVWLFKTPVPARPGFVTSGSGYAAQPTSGNTPLGVTWSAALNSLIVSDPSGNGVDATHPFTWSQPGSILRINLDMNVA